MINFFRNIRKKKAKENKPLQYMRYAIGEIVLVVVGILIALQINNWNENQKNKSELIQVLTTITSNLNSDIKNINSELKDGDGKVIFWEALLKNTDNDSLTALYVKNITLRFIPLDNAGFKTVLSNNNLKLISSTSLQSDLTSYYGTDFTNKERFTDYLTGLAESLTTLTIQESIKVKKRLAFSKRMSEILKNESFAELTHSYLRLYKIVMEKLIERKAEAQNLIAAIEAELK